MEDEIERIRARHEINAATPELDMMSGAWCNVVCPQAHADRATLLPLAERCLKAEAALDEAQARAQRAEEALKLFMSAATPVSTEIDPRGYVWSLAYLDQARAAQTLKEPTNG